MQKHILMRLSLFFFLAVMCCTSLAQSTYAPLNNDYQHLLERYEIKGNRLSNKLFSNIKPGFRKDLVQLTSGLEKDSLAGLSKTDLFNLAYLQNDSWEWLADSYTDSIPAAKLEQINSRKPVFKQLFVKKSDFYQFNNDDFDIHLNPIVNFSVGSDNRSVNSLYTNTRGIEIRGNFSKRLGFYSMLTENQIVYPQYVKDYAKRYDGFPYEGFTKIIDDDSTRFVTDFFSARGYITFKILKNITMQFGHDKNFIGSGIRSLILSDFSAPYLHLKTTTQVGRFQYVTIFAQTVNKQTAIAADGTERRPPKFFTFHHLSLNVTKNLNFGIFETISYGQRKVGFDVNYINPIIFYRFVEGHLGSVDNSIVGADFKLNLARRFSFYGQLVLDEFNFKHFKKKGWWATKYATQLGMRYIDALTIKNLDLQLEYNVARPYTYSHNSSYSNFVHYNMPMAHPLGANFREFLINVRYQPAPRLTFTYNLMRAGHGEDINNVNYGGDILRNYNLLRPGEYNNYIGQGNKAKIRFTDISVSYMLFHNFFIDAGFQHRQVSYSKTPENLKSNIFSTGIRWNIGKRQLLF